VKGGEPEHQAQTFRNKIEHSFSHFAR